MNKSELNLQMSEEVPNQETVSKEVLEIDEEDTSFDIYYDIYEEKYLYIKLQENTAIAPFYYNASYDIEELRNLDDIFKAIEINKVKGHLKDLFDNKKIKLLYKDQDKKVIIMQLEVVLFIKAYKIDFELDKVMIPENEKDQMMNKLYNITKEKLNIAKKLFSQFHSNQNLYNNILDMLSANFDMSGVLIENNNTKNNTNENKKIDTNNNTINITNNDNENDVSLENSNVNENSILEHSDITEDKKFKKKIKKLFEDEKIRKAKKSKEGHTVEMNLKNPTKIPWKEGFFKFKLVKEENSQSTCILKNIEYPKYEIPPKYDGDFTFNFEEIKQPGRYNCTFDVFINDKKMDDVQLK